jgi:hypothetical protein
MRRARSSSRTAIVMVKQPNSPFSLRRNGLGGRVSLAALVTRPQAEHQIGAQRPKASKGTVGFCPQSARRVNAPL